MTKCPPGVLCLSGGISLMIIVAVTAVVILFAMFITPQIQLQQLQQQPQPQQQQQPQQQSINISMKGGDSRYDRAPQPLRDWMVPPELPMGTPFNVPTYSQNGLRPPIIGIATQGMPESFQSVGIINVGEQVLPLYGRRTTGGSDRWNYYTRTDSYNPVPLPVKFQKRNCMDDVGCQEIMSGENIKIDALKKEGKTDIYQFNGPKYIPGLI